MGVSTNGEISYGILFEEGFEFPWDNEQGEGDLDDWWKSVNGYENPHFDPFDSAGNYKPGVAKDDPRIDTYFEHSREWVAAHPVPVELVNYCSDDCPMYILALPGLGTTANRGYPQAIDPAQLVVTAEQAQALKDFCAKHGIETNDEPKWWLSSYYG
jgi:hypothetical protein